MAKIVRSRKIETIFVMIIFCVFAASVLIVLMLGGDIYKKTTELSQEGYNERTCLSYIWTKVKNADERDSVYVDDFQGLSALCIKEQYDGVVYQTIIYLHDGWVRELFCEEGIEFFHEDGKPVIEAKSLAFEQMDNGLIRVAADSGSLLISLRGKTGGIDVE